MDTYQRRTKKGRIAIVRKGQRKKSGISPYQATQIANALLLGTFVAGGLGSIALTHKASKALNKILDIEQVEIAADSARVANRSKNLNPDPKPPDFDRVRPEKSYYHGDAIDVKATEFSMEPTYRRRTKTGKISIVRKNRINRKKIEDRNRVKNIATLVGLGALGVAGLAISGARTQVRNEISAAAHRASLRDLSRRTDDARYATAQIVKKWDDVENTARNKAAQDYGDINDVKNKLADPNHTWEFSYGCKDSKRLNKIIKKLRHGS